MKILRQKNIAIGLLVKTVQELQMFQSDGHPIPKGSIGTIISVRKHEERIDCFCIEWKLNKTYTAISVHDLELNRSIRKFVGRSNAVEQFHIVTKPE